MYEHHAIDIEDIIFQDEDIHVSRKKQSGQRRPVFCAYFRIFFRPPPS